VPLATGAELGPHLTHVAWAQSYLHTKWHLDPSNRLATTDMGRGLYGRRLPKLRNWGLLCPFPWGTVSPSNTMWFGSRPTTTPSRILIHPNVWPQTPTLQTDRTGQDRQHSDRIGRTILQTADFDTTGHRRIGCAFVTSN